LLEHLLEVTAAAAAVITAKAVAAAVLVLGSRLETYL
jgi:hypothetical protein